jgi:membrane-bound lytic murein transglycosylase D
MNAARLSSVVSVAMLLALWGAPAMAADAAGADAPEASEKRARVFPAFRRKKQDKAEDAAAPAVQPGVDEDEVAVDPQDEPAGELPNEGIWEWVDRMEGEIPTAEQIDAIEEGQEVDANLLMFTHDLAGGEVPTGLYTDPRAALKVDPLFLDLVDPSEFDIPIEVNAEVAMWVTYFTGNGRQHYQRWLGRSTRYRPMMYRELDKAGLPRDLVYLSMIESGYNAHAYSHAAAAGLWQFIPSTGKLYDLRIDWWMDERRDPEASVVAAIAFLGELHKMFGDWRLAWGAYNGGPGRIRRATSQANSKDFWVLARGSYLHSETDNYVPKIMAAAIIGKHPERYGFTNIEYQEELTYDKVKVEGSVELEDLAKCAGTTVDEIKALNPALRRYATPPEGYEVRVPVGRRDTFAAAVATVPRSTRETEVVRHTVRKGETLGRIAAKYGTSVSTISSANGLKNANHIYVGMSLRIPGKGGEGSDVAENFGSRATDARPTPSKASPATVHTVKSGETLSTIAAKYGRTTGQIQSYNGLSGSKILVGQKLKVSGSGGTSSASSTSSAASSSTHVVQKGESLGSIEVRRERGTAAEGQRHQGRFAHRRGPEAQGDGRQGLWHQQRQQHQDLRGQERRQPGQDRDRQRRHGQPAAELEWPEVLHDSAGPEAHRQEVAGFRARRPYISGTRAVPSGQTQRRPGASTS